MKNLLNESSNSYNQAKFVQFEFTKLFYNSHIDDVFSGSDNNLEIFSEKIGSALPSSQNLNWTYTFMQHEVATFTFYFNLWLTVGNQHFKKRKILNIVNKVEDECFFFILQLWKCIPDSIRSNNDLNKQNVWNQMTYLRP